MIRHKKPDFERPGPKCDFGGRTEVIECFWYWDEDISELHPALSMSCLVLSAFSRRSRESIDHQMPTWMTGKIITIRSVRCQLWCKQAINAIYRPSRIANVSPMDIHVRLNLTMIILMLTRADAESDDYTLVE
jgi:hypothetical protein